MPEETGAVPPDVLPMLVVPGIPQGIDGWAAEPRLDGWRAWVLVDGTDVMVRTRSGRVITESVPAALGLAALKVALDGELVADAGRLSESPYWGRDWRHGVRLLIHTNHTDSRRGEHAWSTRSV